MKRRAGWIGLTAALLLGGWMIGSAWGVGTMRVIGLFVGSGGLIATDAGTDLTLADMGAPTASQGATSGGECSSALTYRTYVLAFNQAGTTAISAASNDFVPSTTTSKITVTRGSLPSGTVTNWQAYWSSSADGHATKKTCGAQDPPTSSILKSSTTFTCLCGSNVTDTAPTVNTTGIEHGFATTATTFGVPSDTTLTVCGVGCEYTTIQDAIDSITDSVVGPRHYTIRITGEIPAAAVQVNKPYLAIIGDVPTKITTLTVSSNMDDLYFENLSSAGNNSVVATATYAKRVTHRFNRWRQTAVSDETFWWQAAGANLRVVNSELSCRLACVALGNDAIYYGSGNTYNITGVTAGARFIDVPNDSGGNYAGGAQVMEVAPRVLISDNTNTTIEAMRINEVNGTATQPSVWNIYDPQIVIVSTNASRTSRMACFNFATAATSSFTNSFNLWNANCSITSASASGELDGVLIANDADLATWSVNWSGGRIQLSGGATRFDVNNAAAVAGFSVTLSGVATGGSYTGAGVANITGSAIHTGGRLYQFPLATAPATCAIGDRYADTSGADCFCKAANTWEITNATGACV
jgi:hypothetical protein